MGGTMVGTSGAAMTTEGSVTCWVSRLQAGDDSAAQKLWERYFPRLVALARLKIRGTPRRAADEEDVALSAFDSFCRRAEEGRFPDLADRQSLWRLLMVITARKAAHLHRDESRHKRNSARGDGRADPGYNLSDILSREPTPAFAAQAAEECRRLLQNLNDTGLEKIALWKMEGHTVEEIADKLGFAPRSIKRKLKMIRDIWERELAS
jgi:DNA-directed RNA polymerase specialized sigma24 family protein